MIKWFKKNQFKLAVVFYVLFSLFVVSRVLASSYFKGPALIEDSTSTATAAGTTTLTKDSQTNQIFTGATTQTVVLPDSTTLPLSRYFVIQNRSTGLVTVNMNGGTLLTTILPNMQKKVLVTDISTAAGVWDVTNIKIDLSSASNVTGVTGIANGGTNLSTTPTNGQLLIGNGTNYSLSTVSATANQTTVTNGAGTISVGTVQDIATTSSPTFASPTISGDITLSAAGFDSIQVGNEIAKMHSTGLVSGGLLTINANPALFDLSAGTGTIQTYGATPANPTLKRISFGPFTAQTLTNIATADQTYILINSSGAIVQQTTPPTATERRANIYVGRINHPSHTSILAARSLPDYVLGDTNQLYDFFDALGSFNVSGNVVTANGANLSINKSSGVVFRRGVGYQSDNQQPHTLAVAASTLASFLRTTQTAINTTPQTTLDVANYDVGGTVTPVGGGANTATVQRVYLFPSGLIAVQYGQATYSTLAAAITGIKSEAFVLEPTVQDGSILIAYIAVSRTCTSLQDPACASIINAARFDAGTGGGSSAVTTLQQAYNNSSQPQITLDSTRLGVQLRDAATPIANTLFAIQNNAGSTDYLGVTTSKVSVNSLSASSPGLANDTTDGTKVLYNTGTGYLSVGTADALSFGNGNLTAGGLPTNVWMTIGSTGLVGIGVVSAGSTLHVAGSYQGAMTALTTNTTLDGTHQYITADATAAGFAITLPACTSTIFGRSYDIKKIDSTVNAVTVTRSGSDLIDGATTLAIVQQYRAYKFVCSATATWYIF